MDYGASIAATLPGVEVSRIVLFCALLMTISLLRFFSMMDK
jgi:hypothetical protein